jgi:hypothetical protein
MCRRTITNNYTKRFLDNKLAYELRKEFNTVRIEYSITSNRELLQRETEIRKKLQEMGYGFIFL